MKPFGASRLRSDKPEGHLHTNCLWKHSNHCGESPSVLLCDYEVWTDLLSLGVQVFDMHLAVHFS